MYAEENIREINSNTIPNRCGTYIITIKSGRRYVGMSSDLYNRIRRHSCNIVSVSIYMTKNESEARILERWLLCELNPELNISKPVSFNGGIKTVPIDDDTYYTLIEMQQKIRKEYGVNVTISQMISTIVRDVFGNMTTEEFIKLL